MIKHSIKCIRTYLVTFLSIFRRFGQKHDQDTIIIELTRYEAPASNPEQVEKNDDSTTIQLGV